MAIAGRDVHVVFTTITFLVLATTGHSQDSSTFAPLCERAIAVSNGSMQLWSALENITLNVGTMLWDDSFLAYNAETGEYSGLEWDLLQELQQRAGFKINYDVIEKPSNVSWTDVLGYMLSRYDLVTVGYWQVTAERTRRFSCDSPAEFLDLSYRLIVRNEAAPEKPIQARMFTFLEPFSWEVWLVFVLLTIFTGFVYLFFEKRNLENFPNGVRCSSAADSVLWSFMHITGPGGYAPNTWPGKLVVASWSFFAVLYISAYTANLAGFLLVKSNNNIAYTTMQDALREDAQICVEKDAPEMWFKRMYKNYPYVTYVQSDLDGREVLTMLDQYECDAAIVSDMAWRQLRNDRNVNSKCSLKMIDDPLNPIGGGWMSLADYNDRCTAVLRDCLAYHFLDMQDNGRLSDLVQTLFSAYSSDSCSARRLRTSGGARRLRTSGAVQDLSSMAGSSEDVDERPLDLISMAGTIMLHAAVLLVALVLYSEYLTCCFCVKEVEEVTHSQHHYSTDMERNLNRKIDDMMQLLEMQRTAYDGTGIESVI
jgi:hypothetical protein